MLSLCDLLCELCELVPAHIFEVKHCLAVRNNICELFLGYFTNTTQCTNCSSLASILREYLQLNRVEKWNVEDVVR